MNYYLLAQDVWRLRTLRWHAEVSMLKTLAAKHKSTVTKMAVRHKAKALTGDGPRTCYEARRKRRGKPDLVARFGGIILRQDRRAVITDPAPVPVRVPRTELLARLRQRAAEPRPQLLQVQHVRADRVIGQPGRRPGQDEPGQHIGLERRQLIGSRRGARVTQVSYDGQAQARASLAFTDPGRPAIDTTDLQETRETITNQHSGRSGTEAQVLGL